MKNMIVLNRYSLIITIFCVLISSCVPPKSVRPTGSYMSSNRKPIKREKTIDFTDNQKNSQVNSENLSVEPQNTETISENQPAIAGLTDESSDNIEYDENLIEHLPTLNQQLRLISANQIEIQNDLEQIKNIVVELEDRVSKLENNQNTYDKTEKKFNNVILPDELVKKSEQTKPYKKNISSNYKPSDENKVLNMQTENFQQQIDEIKNILNQRDYSKAISELQQIVRKTKDPVTINLCYFYLGESHYGLKQYDKAIDFYKKVINSGDAQIIDDALVKIAEANVNLGDLNEAKKFFKELVSKFPKSENVPYARKMLQKI